MNIEFNDYIQSKILLAPMAGVTDRAFRMICKAHGADLVYTEMVSAKALQFNNKKTKRLLDIGEQEKPAGVQIFGSEPKTMADIAKQICDIGGDTVKLIDINMGCPAPKITNNNEGCALMRVPSLAGRIVAAVRKSVNIPLTVKIRKGFDAAHINAVQVAKICEENGADAVTVHGRTRDQFYSGKSDNNIIAEVKSALHIPVIGNGDIFSGKNAKDMFDETGVDAIMVARGAMGNPFIFDAIKHYLNTGEILPMPSLEERLAVFIEQAEMAVALKGEKTAIVQLRKHAAWYIKGMPNAARIREKLVRVSTLDEFKAIADRITDRSIR